MTASDNKKLVEHIFNETAEGNWQPLIETLTEDFRFILTGSTKWARVYDGKAEVLAKLFAPLRAKLADKIVNTAVRIIAEGDIVVVEARGRNTTIEGKAYNNFYCYVLRLEGGRLKEWTEYADSALVNAVLGDPADVIGA
jgi:uncharacterized protein